ncbi:MAG: hypothetical protein J2P25_01145 [Nocardiopsaceae bacterium]|nr:hypothetical protein [Nocardiopsaceae bacterium]
MAWGRKKDLSPEQIQQVAKKLKKALDKHDTQELSDAAREGNADKAAKALEHLEARGTIKRDPGSGEWKVS